MIRRIILPLLLALLTLASTALASTAVTSEPNDADALRGLKQGKGIFLLDSGEPELAAFYLEGILYTHQAMLKQQVEPNLIVVIIGPTVRFLSQQPTADLTAQQSALDKIATAVHQLNAKGVKIEVCAFAVDYFKVPRPSLLPEVKLVADGWNSLIGYQNKGYGFVPSF